jgi:hypothetical protein
VYVAPATEPILHILAWTRISSLQQLRSGPTFVWQAVATAIAALRLLFLGRRRPNQHFKLHAALHTGSAAPGHGGGAADVVAAIKKTGASRGVVVGFGHRITHGADLPAVAQQINALGWAMVVLSDAYPHNCAVVADGKRFLRLRHSQGQEVDIDEEALGRALARVAEAAAQSGGWTRAAAMLIDSLYEQRRVRTLVQAGDLVYLPAFYTVLLKWARLRYPSAKLFEIAVAVLRQSPFGRERFATSGLMVTPQEAMEYSPMGGQTLYTTTVLGGNVAYLALTGASISGAPAAARSGIAGQAAAATARLGPEDIPPFVEAFLKGMGWKPGDPLPKFVFASRLDRLTRTEGGIEAICSWCTAHGVCVVVLVAPPHARRALAAGWPGERPVRRSGLLTLVEELSPPNPDPDDLDIVARGLRGIDVAVLATCRNEESAIASGDELAARTASNWSLGVCPIVFPHASLSPTVMAALELDEVVTSSMRVGAGGSKLYGPSSEAGLAAGTIALDAGGFFASGNDQSANVRQALKFVAEIAGQEANVSVGSVEAFRGIIRSRLPRAGEGFREEEEEAVAAGAAAGAAAAENDEEEQLAAAAAKASAGLSDAEAAAELAEEAATQASAEVTSSRYVCSGPGVMAAMARRHAELANQSAADAEAAATAASSTAAASGCPCSPAARCFLHRTVRPIEPHSEQRKLYRGVVFRWSQQTDGGGAVEAVSKAIEAPGGPFLCGDQLLAHARHSLSGLAISQSGLDRDGSRRPFFIAPVEIGSPFNTSAQERGGHSLSAQRVAATPEQMRDFHDFSEIALAVVKIEEHPSAQLFTKDIYKAKVFMLENFAFLDVLNKRSLLAMESAIDVQGQAAVEASTSAARAIAVGPGRTWAAVVQGRRQGAPNAPQLMEAADAEAAEARAAGRKVGNFKFPRRALSLGLIADGERFAGWLAMLLSIEFGRTVSKEEAISMWRREREAILRAAGVFPRYK